MSEITGEAPLSFVRALVVQAQQHGHDAAAILQQAGFPSDLLGVEMPAGTISAIEYSRLCMALFETLGDESGGMIPGISTPVGMTRMLLMSVLHCATLADVLERAIEFNAILREPGCQRAHHRLERSGSLVQLEYRPHRVAGEQASILLSMAIWLRVCGWLIGRDIDVLHAGIAGPLPVQRAGLQHFFRCPIAQDQPFNWVAFPAHYLTEKPQRSEAELSEFLATAAYLTVIQPLRAEGPVGQRLRSLLESLPYADWPDFATLAARLHIAPRTLRRRLAAEGDGFQRLCDRIRCDRAVLALRSGCSIEEVAEQAGFSDSSAFHRAFRRWTGVAPSQFR